jgi:hypothetical protein
MLNFLFPGWNWLVIFEPLAYIKWYLHDTKHKTKTKIASTIDKVYDVRKILTSGIFFSNMSNLFKNNMKDVFCVEKRKTLDKPKS